MIQPKRISARGSWPGPITLRSGWWKGVCRRLNDDTDEVALRVERGSIEFLDRCVEWLFENGVPTVWSPPLTAGSAGMWRAAGFDPNRELLMFERSLNHAIGEVAHEVRPGTEDDWTSITDIDRKSFDDVWRMGEVGLRDAMSATPTATVLVIDHEGVAAGFSIVGAAIGTSYLQRIAVRPEQRGLGLGRSLVRASMSWARAAGARTMLLNTQLDNRGAADLYRAEGFVSLPDRLTLFRRLPEERS